MTGAPGNGGATTPGATTTPLNRGELQLALRAIEARKRREEAAKVSFRVS